MKRAKKNSSESRTESLSFRVSEAEKKAIKGKMPKSYENMNQFLREVVTAALQI